MAWTVRWRFPGLSAPAPNAAELVLFGGALLGMTVWVFSAAPGSLTAILNPPFVLLALMMVAAFRTPPRWCTTLVAAAALLASYFASRGLGPFAGDPSPFVRVGAVQLYLATLVTITFMLTVVLLEMRNAMQELRASGERYQNFVEQSSEAVWRIELDVPMAPGLPVNEQIAWLREHAYIAECNLAYLKLNRQFGLPDTDSRLWRADVPWSAIYLEHIGTAAQQGYSTDDLQFTLSTDSRQFTYITSFRGVMHNGNLSRVWCVARDVTELVDLNDASAPETGAIAAVRAAIGRRRGARAAGHRRGSARRNRAAIGGSCDDRRRRRLAGAARSAASAQRGEPYHTRGAVDHPAGHRRLESPGTLRSRTGARPQMAQRIHARQGQSGGGFEGRSGRRGLRFGPQGSHIQADSRAAAKCRQAFRRPIGLRHGFADAERIARGGGGPRRGIRVAIEPVRGARRRDSACGASRTVCAPPTAR